MQQTTTPISAVNPRNHSSHRSAARIRGEHNIGAQVGHRSSAAAMLDRVIADGHVLAPAFAAAVNAAGLGEERLRGFSREFVDGPE